MQDCEIRVRGHRVVEEVEEAISAGHDLALETAMEEDVDIVNVSKPNKNWFVWLLGHVQSIECSDSVSQLCKR